jgi:hypothetical protein
MAESAENAQAKQETWIVGLVAMAGLACIGLVAVALVMILKQGGPMTAAAPAGVTASPVINIQTGPAAAPAGIVRPAEPAKPQANREAAQNALAAALPDKFQPSGPSVARADKPAGADASKLALPAPDKRAGVTVRGEVPAPQQARNPQPMPVRYRSTADGTVETLYAPRVTASTPLPPDKLFAESGSSGDNWDLSLIEPRSTYAIDGYRAPEGFAFFTATLVLRAKGNGVVPDLGALEVRDSEGTAYLANPELSSALPTNMAAGQEAKGTVAVLISEQAPLASFVIFVMNTGDAPVLLPLAQR